ncbi:MAG: oligosaccharide flippase family protein [Nodosilinea sp.]
MANFFNNISNRVVSVCRKSIFKDTSWMLLSKMLGAIVQTAYFILVARYLGAENYGTFEGIKAIWAILFPFIGLGMGDMLVQHVSRDQAKFSRYWGDSLLVFMMSVGVALITIFPLVVMLFPSVSPVFILLVLIADVVGLKLCNYAGLAFISVHKVKRASQFSMIYVVSKLITALFLPLFPEDQRLLAWGFLYCIGSIIPGVILFALVSRNIGKPAFNLKVFNPSQLKQGFFFSLSESASGINAQIDRTMLVSLASPTAAGIYGAGYRFIDMGNIPIFAFLGANYARFFKHGEAGIKGSFGFARKFLPLACLYGAASAGALILFAPLVPKILGDEYVQSSLVLIWFAPLHLITGLQFLAADTLTGAGLQRSRSFIQVGAAILNVSLNFYLIPIYSWQGAIWATLSSECFKLVTLWVVVFFTYQKAVKLDHSRR